MKPANLNTNIITRITTCLAAILIWSAPDCRSADRGGDIRVSLLTCSPGKEIYQLEGHTALRLTKTDSLNEAGEVFEPGYDAVVNWGVFDFSAPNFVYRFVKGDTDYMACAYSFDGFMEEYRLEGRRVTEQVRNLTQEQARRLEALVSANIRPENRTYRYNYVKDNCATRPLAMIEKALGDTIALGINGTAGKSDAPATFRSEMKHYHRNYPWYQFGIDLALGNGIDHPISQRERTFAPIKLEEALSGATFTDTCGTKRPLVTDSIMLNHGITGGVTAPPTSWPFSPVGISVVLLVFVAMFSFYDMHRRQITRWLDTILYGTMFLAGCLICFLVFISSHEATSPNWLLLWLNPFCIIAAVGVWIKRCKRAVYCYQICNFAALLLLLAGHRFTGQALNTAFPLLILCDMMRSATYIYVYLRNQKRLASEANKRKG